MHSSLKFHKLSTSLQLVPRSKNRILSHCSIPAAPPTPPARVYSPKGNYNPDFNQHRQFLPVFVLYVNGITLFYVWLLSLNAVFKIHPCFAYSWKAFILIAV